MSMSKDWTTPFKKLVNSPKKKVNIKGEYDFTGGGLKIPTEIVPKIPLAKSSNHEEGGAEA